MPRSTLGDMHNLLMEQLERLITAEPEDVDLEVKRSRAIAAVATSINSNSANIIELTKIRAESLDDFPKMLDVSKG